MAIRWDRSELDAAAREELLAAGFECVADVVLALRELRAPARPATGVTVREIAGDDDWRAVFELQLAHGGRGLRRVRDRFLERAERAHAAAGRGWARRVARRLHRGRRAHRDLGVFSDREIARYQAVETAPEHRRRGICATLVHAAARLALDRWRPRSVAIVAAAGGPAKPIYESLGFAEVETMPAAFREPPSP